MGTQGLENKKGVIYAEYDFSKEGGAVGDITLRGGVLPKGAIVTSGIIHVPTALTSGGSATIALKVVGTADVLAATAVASFSEDALLDVVPDGEASNMVLCAANAAVVATVAVAVLTAGQFVVALEYVVTE